MGLSNLAVTWGLHSVHVDGHVKAEVSGSAGGREVILEIWGCWGTEKWCYNRGYERWRVFHVYFCAG